MLYEKSGLAGNPGNPYGFVQVIAPWVWPYVSMPVYYLMSEHDNFALHWYHSCDRQRPMCPRHDPVFTGPVLSPGINPYNPCQSGFWPAENF